tara:strand:- start:32230 stop:33774 length:1545 start_codon:yes stop_codon:yes gene_type:complete
MKFNLSASSLNLYLESQLRFYYTYIEKADADTEVPQVYGTAGNIVHEALEYFAKESDSVKELLGVTGTDQLKRNTCQWFNDEWARLKIKYQKGMWIPSRKDYHILDKSKYAICVDRGIKLLEEKYKNPVPEELIEIQYNDDIKIKGIIDLPCELDGETVIVDWKTSSRVDDGGSFKRQGLFYCMLHQLKHGKLPKKVIFEYLKINKVKEYVFQLNEVLDFRLYLTKIIEEILQKGKDISNYEVGDYDSPFNQHKKKCQEQYNLRNGINNPMEMDLQMAENKTRYLKAEEINNAVEKVNNKGADVSEWGTLKISKLPADTSFAVMLESELKRDYYTYDDAVSTSNYFHVAHEETDAVKKLYVSESAINRFLEKNPDFAESLEDVDEEYILSGNRKTVTLSKNIEGETVLISRTKFATKDKEGKALTLYPQFINLVKNKVERKGKPTILRTPKDEDIMALTEKYKVALTKMLEEGKQVDYKKHYIGAVVNKLMPELSEKLGKIYEEHVKGDSDSLL